MKCGKCGKQTEDETSPFTIIQYGEVCKECWCEEFGNYLEKHPIVSRRLLNATQETTKEKQ